jgi:proteasome assembly chaperone (PAC2) family protein
VSELYYARNKAAGRDLILWHGNTQALTTFGQYELCGRVLSVSQDLGCRYLISLGGFKIEEAKPVPQIFCAATDTDTLNEALGLGTKIMVGQIFGVAGIVVGLAKLKDFKGFSLLVETRGTYPDTVAAGAVLGSLSKFLNLDLNMAALEGAAEETKRTLESFGLIKSYTQEKEKKEEQQFRWSV